MTKLSYTRLNTYQTCQRKYYWQYVRSVVPAGRTLPLEFGKAWHLAMNAWHTHKDIARAKEAFNSAFEDSRDDDRRTRKTAHKMLDEYAKKYSPEVITFRLYELEIREQVGDVLYRMKVDGVLEWDGKLWGLEHKTASTLGYGYLKSFKPNLQLAGYVWGLQRAVDPSITDMVVDISRVTYLEPREGERFLRHTETVQPWELEEFVRVVAHVGQRLTEQGDAFEAFPPNWGACTQYGECAYRPLCTAPPSIRGDLVEKLYQPRKDLDAEV